MEANIVRFGELYEIPSSNGLSRPSAVRGEGFKMINMGELFANNIISNIPMERVQMSDKEQEKFFVKEGDLLFARQSLVAEGAGKCSIVKNFSEPTTFESHLIRVRLNKRSCDSWFYYYLFQLKSNPIKAIINQCAQAGIRGSELVRVKVPHPPLPTQKKIASILSAYDNLIQNYKKQIEDLQTTASELYKEWFVRFRFPGYKTTQFENGIPVGWKVETANEMFNISIGKTPPRAEQEWFTTSTDDVKWVSISDMNQGIFIEDTSEKLTASAVEKFKIIIVPKDTVLLSFKLTVGKVSITKTETCTNEAIAHFKLPNLNMREYIFNYLSMFPYQKLGNTSAIGTAINSQIVKKMKIVVPTKTLLDQYHTIAGCIFDKIGKLGDEITNLTQQRDLLLPRLMSGKIEIQ